MESQHGWRTVLDPTTQESYFWHASSGRTSWEPPPEIGASPRPNLSHLSALGDLLRSPDKPPDQPPGASLGPADDLIPASLRARLERSGADSSNALPSRRGIPPRLPERREGASEALLEAQHQVRELRGQNEALEESTRRLREENAALGDLAGELAEQVAPGSQGRQCLEELAALKEGLAGQERVLAELQSERIGHIQEATRLGAEVCAGQAQIRELSIEKSSLQALMHQLEDKLGDSSAALLSMVQSSSPEQAASPGPVDRAEHQRVLAVLASQQARILKLEREAEEHAALQGLAAELCQMAERGKQEVRELRARCALLEAAGGSPAVHPGPMSSCGSTCDLVEGLPGGEVLESLHLSCCSTEEPKEQGKHSEQGGARGREGPLQGQQRGLDLQAA